jgi:hypothetical protein
VTFGLARTGESGIAAWRRTQGILDLGMSRVAVL